MAEHALGDAGVEGVGQGYRRAYVGDEVIVDGTGEFAAGSACAAVVHAQHGIAAGCEAVGDTFEWLVAQYLLVAVLLAAARGEYQQGARSAAVGGGECAAQCDAGVVVVHCHVALGGAGSERQQRKCGCGCEEV